MNTVGAQLMRVNQLSQDAAGSGDICLFSLSLRPAQLEHLAKKSFRALLGNLGNDCQA